MPNQLLSNLHILRVLGLKALLRSARTRRWSDRTLRGFYSTQAIITSFRLGLFDALRSSSSIYIAAFVSDRGYNRKTVQILVDYLQELGLIRGSGDIYSLTTDGRLVTEDMVGVFDIAYAYQDVVHGLEAMARGEKVYGRELTRRLDYVAKGSGEIGRLFAFPMVAAELAQYRYRCALDLGCGAAVFLIDLCRRNPDLRAYGIDVAPEAISQGEAALVEAGLQARVQLFEGDIFNLTPLAERLHDVDVITSVYVLHEFQERIPQVLEQIRAAFPGVPLVMCEVIRHTPEQLAAQPGGVMEIQFFHELADQRLFTLEEWRAMFRQAGLQDVTEHYLASVRTCIFTVK